MERIVSTFYCYRAAVSSPVPPGDHCYVYWRSPLLFHQFLDCFSFGILHKRLLALDVHFAAFFWIGLNTLSVSRIENLKARSCASSLRAPVDQLKINIPRPVVFVWVCVCVCIISYLNCAYNFVHTCSFCIYLVLIYLRLEV